MDYKKACKLLELKHKFNEQELKKAYYKKALQYHPDKNSQTEEKLKRDEVQGKQQANHTHHAVGKKVRQTIQELGGTMPEDLAVPDKGIKQLEREQKKLEKGE